MKDNNQTRQNWFSSLVYFSILGATFYASCAILAIHNQENLLMQTVLYASVLLVSIKLGRFGVAMIARSQGRILYTVLVNATGIVIGVVLLLTVSLIFPELSVSIIALVVSSVIAFFILGTLSPFFLSDRRISTR